MTILSGGNDVKELELLYAAEKCKNGTAILHLRFLKVKHTLIIWLSHSILRYLFKENKSIHLYKVLHMKIIAALFVIATTQISINKELISK